MPGRHFSRSPGQEQFQHGNAREAVGRWIREHREFLGLSQRALCLRLRARGLDVPQPTLSRWEKGDLAPSAEVLGELARALGTTLETLEEVLARAARIERVDLTGVSAEQLVGEGDEAARTGLLRRAADRYEAALELEALRPGVLAAGERGRILVRLAWAHEHLWELEAARDALRRLSRVPDLPVAVSFRALIEHLVVEHRFGDTLAAEAFAERLEHLAGDQDPPGRALGLQALGSWHFGEERFDRALPLFRQAHALYRRLGNRLEEARTQAFLAYCMARADGEKKGKQAAEAAVAAAREIHAREVEAIALRITGRIQGDAGDLLGALASLEASATVARGAGLEAEEFISLWHAWRFAREEERPAYARRLRRLLRKVHPRLPEAREFVAVGAAGNEEEDER